MLDKMVIGLPLKEDKKGSKAKVVKVKKLNNQINLKI